MFVRGVGKTRHMIASLTFCNIIFVRNIETCEIGSHVPSYWSSGGTLNFIGIKVAIMLWTNGVLPSNIHSSISSGPVLALCNAFRNWWLKSTLLGKSNFDSCSELDSCHLFILSRGSSRSAQNGNWLSLFTPIAGVDLGVDVPIASMSFGPWEKSEICCCTNWS